MTPARYFQNTIWQNDPDICHQSISAFLIALTRPRGNVTINRVSQGAQMLYSTWLYFQLHFHVAHACIQTNHQRPKHDVKSSHLARFQALTVAQ